MFYANTIHAYGVPSPHQETWRAFGMAYRLFNRRDELQRLIAWAARKRLSGPRKAYEYLLADCEHHLMRLRGDRPQLIGWATSLHMISMLFRYTPRFYHRGAAASYRR